MNLTPFGSCEEFLDYGRTNLARRISRGDFEGSGAHFGWPSADVALPGMAPPAAGFAGISESRGVATHSGTNVQERGIDEPDILKTNGTAMLVIHRSTLRAIDVSGAEPVERGSLELHPSESHQMLLVGSRVLVFSTRWNSKTFEGKPGLVTRIDVVDVSDLDALSVERSISVDSRFVSARLVDGVARIVVTSTHRIKLVHPRSHRRAAIDRAIDLNRAAVKTSSINDWIPRVAVRERGQRARVSPLVECQDAFRPAVFSGMSTVTVFSIDPANAEPGRGVSVLADARDVYATATSLVVTTSQWRRAGRTLRHTDLHLFDISDPAAAVYRDSSSVPGSLLSSWAISHHDGHLRVATTAEKIGDPDITNNMVTVFDTSAGLEQVGRLEGLGRPGEQIRGVRFVGDRGYVVTFRRIDPFYVLDLEDPRNPTVQGELKIPGYSAYLHPVGEDRVLGIGSNGNLDGDVLGGQISLYDTSDPAEPERIDNLTFAGETPVEWQGHHSVLYWPATRTMFVPLSDWRPGSFQGLLAIEVDDAGLTEIGRVSHPKREIGWTDTAIQREAIVGDSLYTLSNTGLLASDLTSFEDRSWIAWHDPFVSMHTVVGSDRGFRDGYSALFDEPGQLARSKAGAILYMVDARNRRIRMIEGSWWWGKTETLRFRPAVPSASDELQEELPDLPTGVAAADDGSVFVSTSCAVWRITTGKDQQLSHVAGLPGACSVSTLPVDGIGALAGFGSIGHLAIDGDVLYVADTGAHAIRRVDIGEQNFGRVSTFAGVLGLPGSSDGAPTSSRFRAPRSIAVAPDGAVFVADTANGSVRRIADDWVTTSATGLADPASVLFDEVTGKLYVAEMGRDAIVAVANGTVEQIAGGDKGFRDGAPERARMSSPTALAWDTWGGILIADTMNHRVRVLETESQWLYW